MKYVFTIVACFLVRFGFSQVSESSPLKTFQRDDFRVQYPGTWDLDTTSSPRAKFMLFSPLESDSDKFRENVNLIIQDLKGMQIDLDRYKKITEQQIQGMLKDGKVYGSEIEDHGKGDHYRISYSGTIGAFKVEVTSICYIKMEKAYLLTFTAESGKYEKFKDAGEGVLNSFTLTN